MKTLFGITGYKNTFFIAFILLTSLLLASSEATCWAQTDKKQKPTTHYGNVLNVGMGPGYFGSLFLPSPYFTANYEIDVARNFTLAPFAGFASYRSDAYLSGNVYYYYRATILPIGVKATYYFDEILNASKRWDFYGAASVGYTYFKKGWDYGYPGMVGTIPGISNRFLQLHLGCEYHLSSHTGIYLDVGNGVSVIGFALHRL